MARRKVGNPLAFAVLGSLVERSMHPYEISSMLKSRGKDLSIKLNYGSLYSVVAALEKHGYVEAVETVRDGNRPERTVYAITEAGREEFADWLSELLGTPERQFSPLEAGLAYAAAFPPAKVADLLERRVKTLDAEVEEIEDSHAAVTAAKLPRMFWIESEFRLALVQAEIAYLRRLIQEIRSDELEGSAFWRKAHELAGKLGIEPGDLFKDPVKYFGEEFPWLQNAPPER
jgi:DNA-binding PadR family transcriptional regulator